MADDEARELCPLCERDILVGNLTKHHFVPKSCGGRETKNICRTCHKQLHVLFSNKQLAAELNSVEALATDEGVQKYLAWVKTKNPDKYFRGRRKKKT